MIKMSHSPDHFWITNRQERVSSACVGVGGQHVVCIVTSIVTGPAKLYLRSLTIHRYEQFQSCPRIELSPEDNLILGINGSGKTSLLRLLGAILRFNYRELLGQPFDIEFEMTLDRGSNESIFINGHVLQQPALLEAGQPSQGKPPQGRRAVRSKYDGFEAIFEIRYGNEHTYTARVRDSRLSVDGLDSPRQDMPVESWLTDDIAVYIDDIGTIELSNDAKATFMVRETDDDFAQLTENVAYAYVVDRSRDELWRSMAVLEYRLSEPEDRQWFRLLYELAMRTAEQASSRGQQLVVEYERNADNGSGLDIGSVLEPLDAERMSLRLKIEETTSTGDRIQLEGKGVELRVRFGSGTEVIDSRLTFGQKRLITIALGALLAGGSPMLIDEIDNGLHPALLEKAMTLIQGRQTFIASHNKLVVDMLNYDSPEEIRQTIHICRRNPDGTQSLVALSDTQAREVFDKIEIGLMNPSDVLQREGLW